MSEIKIASKIFVLLVIAVVVLLSPALAEDRLGSAKTLQEVSEKDVVEMDATDVALAILNSASQSTLVDAKFLGVTSQILISTDPRQMYPIDGDSYVILSTGNAEDVLSGDATVFISTDVDGRDFENAHPRKPDLDTYDVATLIINLTVPDSANTLSFKWQYGSEEIPQYIGSDYMDYFIAKVVLPDGVQYDITNMPNGEVPTVDTVVDYVNVPGGSSEFPTPPFPIPNDVALNAMTTAGPKDTNFVPFTGVFDVSAYRGQQITLIFEVGDAGDAILDTAVFLDDLGFDVVETEEKLQLKPGTLSITKHDSTADITVTIVNPDTTHTITTTFNAYVGVVWTNGTTTYTIQQTKAVTLPPSGSSDEEFTVTIPSTTSDIVGYYIGVKRFDVPPQSPEGVTNQYEFYEISGSEIVNIIGIDPTSFPKIYVNVFVNTSCAKSGGLTVDDFTIKENGVVVDIESFDFSGSTTTGKLDLAVVFDDTGSMIEEIYDMKSKVQDLIDEIESSGLDTRYALISFKDDVTIRTLWTSDADSFKDAVNDLYASGGDDTPENALDAIETALSLGFRSDAKKVILVITDAPSHQKGDGTIISEYTKSEVKNDLMSSGVIFIAVSPDFEVSQEPYVDIRELAEDVGGLWIDIHSADFSEILDTITGIITGIYTLDYTTPDLTPGTTRTVTVIVNDPYCAEGSDSSSYVSPTIITSLIRMIPSKTTVAPGDQFNLDIFVSGETAKAVLINFTFNPDQVSVVDTTTYGKFSLMDIVILGSNYVKYLGVSSTPVDISTSTKIATITFQVAEDVTEGEINFGIVKATVDGSNVSVEVTPVTIVLEPWQKYDSDGNGKISDMELINAIMDWLNGDISDMELLNVILKWLS